MQHQWLWRLIQLGVLVFLLGCVTETERMPYRRYYDPYQDESVLDELKREFGWRKNTQGVTEAPYTRAARSVKEGVADWFSDEETTKGTPGWKRSLEQLKQAQQRPSADRKNSTNKAVLNNERWERPNV